MVKELGIAALLISSFIGYFTYIPQIIKTIRTKSSKDCSIGTWVLTTVSLSFYEIYAISAGITEIMITAGVELILSIIAALLIVKYRNKQGGADKCSIQ